MKGRTPRRKWNSFRASNRIPEVDLERKLTDIRRMQAELKRDRRIEEASLWDFLFENNKLLKESIAKYSLEEVLEGLIPVTKPHEEPLPYSEYFRQFIIYKAVTAAAIYGKPTTERPRYSDLYSQGSVPKQNNTRSIDELFEKLSERQKALQILRSDFVDYEEPRPESEATTITAERRSRLSLKPINARPLHKRRDSRASDASLAAVDREYAHAHAPETDVSQENKLPIIKQRPGIAPGNAKGKEPKADIEVLKLPNIEPI